jgi:hypothetical protein
MTISAVEEVMGPDNSTAITLGVEEVSAVTAATSKAKKRIRRDRARLGPGFT